MARLNRAHTMTPQIEISDVRTLSRGDLSVLAQPRPPRSLQTLRDSHHRVARAVAAGMRNDVIADLCGYSVNRVSMLRQDPAFKELIAHYRAILTTEFAEAADPVIDYMRTNALKAQRMISDKLDKATEEEEFLPTRDLLGIAELGLDRTGYGKVNKNVNVNVDFAANLEAMRKRAAEVEAKRGAAPRTIEASVSPRPQSPQDGGQSALPSPAASPLRRI